MELWDEGEGVLVEGAAGEVGGFGEAVGEVWHWVDAAGEAIGHRAGLAAKGWSAIDRVVFGGRADNHADERQVEHRGGEDGGVAVVAAGEATHHFRGARSVVLRPAVGRIGVVDIDASGEFLDLAFERDSATAVPFADFETEQVVVPPSGFGGVGMRAAAGDGDQVAAAE